MLTGTPLDLTPFGGVLAALGWVYWITAAAIVVLALWWPRRWWLKLVSATVVLTVVIYPLFVRPVEKRIDTAQLERQKSQARLDAALAHFEMRCKSAGEKIVRTVDNVEGVVWMKWRDKETNRGDQFKLDDPYGQDCGAEGCIEQLLRLENTRGRFKRDVEIRKDRYRYVETTDPMDGKRYRYVGKMVPRWTDDAVTKWRQDKGEDIPDDAYWFKPIRTVIEKFTARYGITWDDLSTHEDRELWIAGGSLKIIDLRTNEVIAERVGYMMDRGQGNRSGSRAPWFAAPEVACPKFPNAPGGGPYMSNRSHPFILEVLKPIKEQ